MDFRLGPFRVFVAVAEEQSFSRAARRMSVTQPWVSAKIRQLEEHLGVTLFLRGHSPAANAQLTEPGRLLFEQARRVLREGERFIELAHELSGAAPSRLRIGAESFSFDIPERVMLVDRYGEQHPDTEIAIENLRSDDLRARLLTKEIDVAFVSGPAPTDDRLDCLLLRSLRVELVIPIENPLARKRNIDVNALRGQTIMVNPSRSHPLSTLTGDFWRAQEANVIESREPNTLASLREAQRRRCLAHALETMPLAALGEDMVRRPIVGDPLTVDFWLVKRRDANEPAVVDFWALAEASRSAR